MNVRNQIEMSPDEVLEFLDAGEIVVCATNGLRGWPHVMPLWYVVRNAEIWAWTYAKSQKARNLERDPRATLQIEAGDIYDELRGVMLECEVVLHRDVDTVRTFGADLFTRYRTYPPHALHDIVERQATKRVCLQFVERRRATWDHRKLHDPHERRRR